MTRQRLSTRERQRCFDDAGGLCLLCGMPIRPGEAWDVAHRVALAAGGEDFPWNRFPAHRACHRAETAAVDIPRIAKTKRMRAKHSGAWKPTSRSLRHPTWKRKVSGEVVRR